MKEEKSKNRNKNLTANTLGVMQGKAVRTHSGKIIRQYPPKVGYHGSQDETRLSPEE